MLVLRTPEMKCKRCKGRICPDCKIVNVCIHTAQIWGPGVALMGQRDPREWLCKSCAKKRRIAAGWKD